MIFCRKYLSKLLSDEDDDVVADLDATMTRRDYQKHRKKGSAFRRSQHEIVLPQLLGDDEDSYALKYHQVLDEKNKLEVILKKKQRQETAMNENLSKLKGLIKESENNGNFRNQINMMVQNGPNYVEANSKYAHKLLSICKMIVAQMLSMFCMRLCFDVECACWEYVEIRCIFRRMKIVDLRHLF